MPDPTGPDAVLDDIAAADATDMGNVSLRSDAREQIGDCRTTAR
jgi:hypothetical protein